MPSSVRLYHAVSNYVTIYAPYHYESERNVSRTRMTENEQKEYQAQMALWKADIEDAKKYLIKHNAEDLIPMLCTDIDTPIKELPKQIMARI